MLIYDPKDPHRIRDLLFITLVLLLLGYVALNAVVPNADIIIAARVLQAAASVVVLYVYGSDAWAAFTRPQPERSDFLILGIWLGFFSGLAQAVYAILFRLAGAPAWMLYMETVAPTVLISVLAAVLHVAAPGGLDGTVPRRNKIALGAMFGLGVVGVGVLLFLRPDLASVIERTPMWLRDFWETGLLMEPGRSAG